MTRPIFPFHQHSPFIRQREAGRPESLDRSFHFSIEKSIDPNAISGFGGFQLLDTRGVDFEQLERMFPPIKSHFFVVYDCGSMG